MDSPARNDRLVFGSLVLASVLLQLPFWNRALSLYDEGSILAIAEALASGDALYRDRVTQLGPFTYELMGWLFRVVGQDLWVPRALQGAIFSGCVALAYLLVRDVLGIRWGVAAAASVLAVKTLAFPYWTAINYAPVGLLWCMVSAFLTSRFLAAPGPGVRWLLASGLAIGLAFVTKQNLGALLGVTTALTVFADWRRGDDRTLGSLSVRATALTGGSLAPIVAVVAAYGLYGTLDDLINWTVIGLTHMADPYQIPFPGLELWAATPERLGEIAFTYFPPPLLLWSWHGGLDISSPPTALLIEVFVKAAYFAPFAFAAALAWRLARDASSAARDPWSLRLNALALGVACYASVLARGRTDWIHLMSIYPALLPGCVIALAQLGSKRPARWITWSAAAVWATAGIGVGVAVFAVYRVAVETPRGQLLGAPDAARNANRVLRYLASQPKDVDVLLLRGEPLYYYLAGRSIPIRFDLFMPGVIGAPENDAQIADELASIDQVLYNPKIFPTVPMPITSYAPLTADALASRFAPDAIVSETAFLLLPSDSLSSETPVVDWWNEYDRLSFESAGAAGAPERATFMMYRILVAALGAPGERSCAILEHTVAPGEELAATPIAFPSAFWAAGRRRPTPAADFSVRVRTATASVVLYQETVRVDPPSPPLRLPLAAFSGQPVELEVCAAAPTGGSAAERAGWARLRIERRLPSGAG